MKKRNKDRGRNLIDKNQKQEIDRRKGTVQI